MNLFLILLCSWSLEGDIHLDELNIGKLGPFGSYNGRTVFSHSKGASMVFPLMLFDFETEKLRLIKDGRVPVILPFVVPLEDGFALFSRINAFRSKVFYVDREGAFWKTGRIADLQGWDESLVLIYVAPEKPGRAYLTFKHQEEQTLILALVDLRKNKLEYLTNLSLKPDDSPNKIWTTDAQKLYLVTKPSGQIDRISTDSFLVLETLRKARDPVLKSDKKLRAFNGRYHGILSSPTFNGQYMAFKYLKCYDDFGNVLDKPKTATLSLTDKGTRESVLAVLAIHKNKELVYHWIDREFRIRSHKKKE